jgi:hypothetical protein
MAASRLPPRVKIDPSAFPDRNVGVLHVYPSYVPGHDSELHTLCAIGDGAHRWPWGLLLPNDAGVPPDSYVREVARPLSILRSTIRRARQRVLNRIEDARSRAFFADAARASGATLLHAHFGPTGVLVAPVARELGVPLVTRSTATM